VINFRLTTTSDAAGNFNVDESDANNAVTISVNTIPAEFKLPTIPPVLAVGSSRYQVFKGENGAEAESAAVALGAHLVTINSVEEDVALIRIMGSDAFLAFFPNLGRPFDYTYDLTQTKTVALGSAYWIGRFSVPTMGSGSDFPERYLMYSFATAWSSGEVSSYSGQMSPNNRVDPGISFAPAVMPRAMPFYFMNIGAGAGDRGNWASTQGIYPAGGISPYQAALGLAEIILQDAVHIAGSKVDDVLISLSEASELFGWAGADLLIGGAGNDTIDGGDGWDIADYANSPNPIKVDLRLSSGQVVQDG
jgi:hypothetical protein